MPSSPDDALAAARRSPARHVVGALAIAAWTFYSSWVLALILPVDVDNKRAWVSELGADGQPFHLVYRWGDRISSVLLVATGIAILLEGRRLSTGDRFAPRRDWLALVVLYVIGGLNLFVESFNGLPCAPSLDQACYDRLEGANPTTAEMFHAAASLIGTTSLILGIALSWWMVRWRRGPAWWALGVLTLLAAVGEIMSGLGIWAWTGLVQRAALGTMALCGIWSVYWLDFSDSGPSKNDGAESCEPRERTSGGLT